MEKERKILITYNGEYFLEYIDDKTLNNNVFYFNDYIFELYTTKVFKNYIKNNIKKIAIKFNYDLTENSLSILLNQVLLELSDMVKIDSDIDIKNLIKNKKTKEELEYDILKHTDNNINKKELVKKVIGKESIVYKILSK